MNKRFALVFIALALGVWPVTAQKIETQVAGDAAITRVQTALNHLTVIQLSEPVLSVAAGSQAFKVEWRENKVFIEPTEPNASTNLFIWTKSGRLNYELAPAGTVAQMDFAIDQPAPDPPASKAPETRSGRAAAADPPSQATVATEGLLGGKPVRLASYKRGKNRVQLQVKDLFRQADRLYIRYTVDNTTKRAYEVGKPRVLFLQVPQVPAPLTGRREWQLTDSEAERIESQGQRPLEIIDQELRSARVEPGQETVGVVGVRLPSGSRGPFVIRLVLPNYEQGEVTATVVL
jgi:Conjugal transfer protein